MLVAFGSDGEAHLAKIKIIALFTMISLVFDWRNLAYIALVIVKSVFFGVGLDALLSNYLIADCGESIGRYSW
jgi:hypothetical protein